MLIKNISALIIILTMIPFTVAFSADEPEISAKSAIVIDADSGNILFSKNAFDRRSMASTTKIMTSIIAVESGLLNCSVIASHDVVCDGTSVGISKGDTFTLETLVYAMLLESGNDAAILTAEYLGTTEENFSRLMNLKASEIGMKNTNFVTSSGLDADEHYSNAYDMALLGAYAIKNPVFRKMCSSKTYKADYIVPDITTTYSNHNKLQNMYEGVFGIKTGFTKKSGRCLVSACERNGTTLVAVTLSAPNDWNDHIAMYDYCFGNVDKDTVQIDVPSEVTLYGGTESAVKINIPTLNIDSNMSVEYKILLPAVVYAPVSAGDIIGSVVIYNDEKQLCKIPITAKNSVDAVLGKQNPTLSFIDKLKILFVKS